MSDSNILSQYNIQCEEVVDSTNDEAKRLVVDNPQGYLVNKKIVWAKTQLAGKGRDRRSWVSIDGNLFYTAIITPEVETNQLPQMAFIAGLALKEALEYFLPKDVKIKFKWPNDILIDGKKLAGILLESDYVGNPKVRKVFVGIGVNVEHCPSDLPIQTTKLYDYIDEKVELRSIIERWIVSFDRWLRLWEREGFEKPRIVWLAHAHGLGKVTKVRFAQQEHEGAFKEVDETGCLILTLADGSDKKIAAGDVYFSI